MLWWDVHRKIETLGYYDLNRMFIKMHPFKPMMKWKQTVYKKARFSG